MIRARIFLQACWIIPVGCAFYMMCAHWVAVPFWDEWFTPGAQLASYYQGTLSLSELWSQHNEHRLLVPRLIWLPIAIVAGWDVRYEMVLTFALACLGSFGLFKLLRASNKQTDLTRSSFALPHFSQSAIRHQPLASVFAFGLMNLVLFSPRQYESFLVGTQGQTLVPSVLLLFTLLTNLSGKSIGAKTIINAALALVSTYSFGNGMLVWLFAFPVCNGRPAGEPRQSWNQKILWRLLYLLIAGLSIAVYFVGYRRPSVTPPMVLPFEQWGAFTRFVSVWIGALFTVPTPETWGAILLLAFSGLTIISVKQIQRTGSWRSYYPWLILGVYTLASASIAAMARLGFDHSMAADSRYTAFSAFFYVALIGLWLTVYQHRTNPLGLRWIWRAAGTALFLGMLLLWLITFRNERRFLRGDHRHRKHTELVVQWIEAIPLNPELGLTSPYPREQTIRTIRTIAANDGLRPRLVSSTLVQAVNKPPPTIDSNDLSAGKLDWGILDPNKGHVALAGWARLPNQERPADCVVVGFETTDQKWQPFCVLGTGEKRNDVAKTLGLAGLKRCGFLWTVDAHGLVPAGATLRAWAIDLAQERVYPISGAVYLQPVQTN